MSSESKQSPVTANVTPARGLGLDQIKPDTNNNPPTQDDDGESLKPAQPAAPQLGDSGAQKSELLQQVWGKHGKLILFASVGVCMLCYEFDNTTTSTYYSYALSEFNAVSLSSAWNVVLNLAFALMKPLWAKASDIWGRGELYPVALALIVAGLVVAASAASFAAVAAGTLVRVLGMSAVNSVNDIVMADHTSTRQRGFGVNFQFWPYLVLPWVSGYVVDAVVARIGWRWGVGINAVVWPVGIAAVAAVLLAFQRRANKTLAINRPQHLNSQPKPTLTAVLSSLDLGGLLIAILSLGCILVPLSIASLQPRGYATPWIVALLVLGPLGLLVALPAYEARVAAHPVFPVRYARHRAIRLAFGLYFLDYAAAEATHTYLYPWAVVARGLPVWQATYLYQTNGVMAVLAGTAFGAAMYRTRAYKRGIMAGCVARAAGYGAMFCVRTASAPLSVGALFALQLVQGLGDGLVQTGGFVAATVAVPHRETAQMTALVVLVGMLGSSVGDAVAGAVYTGTFRAELRRRLGGAATAELVDAVFNSITADLPAWGSAERVAVNTAYNFVTSYIYIAAMVIIAPSFLLVYLLPNQRLGDSQNLVEAHGMLPEANEMVPPDSRKEKQRVQEVSGTS